MFICNECLDRYDFTCSIALTPKSEGLCEHCREVKVCNDVPHGTYTIKPKMKFIASFGWDSEKEDWVKVEK